MCRPLLRGNQLHSMEVVEVVEDTLYPLPRPRELATRLNLALDRIEVQRGEALSFGEVEQKLRLRGVALSRSRWAYMIRGEMWRVRDRKLIDALSEILDVPARFLYIGELPQSMASELAPVRALRALKVENFAARALGDIAPDALAAITDVLHRLDEEDSHERR